MGFGYASLDDLKKIVPVNYTAPVIQVFSLPTLDDVPIDIPNHSLAKQSITATPQLQPSPLIPADMKVRYTIPA